MIVFFRLLKIEFIGQIPFFRPPVPSDWHISINKARSEFFLGQIRHFQSRFNQKEIFLLLEKPSIWTGSIEVPFDWEYPDEEPVKFPYIAIYF